MDIVAKIPVWLIETAQDRPFALAFAVLMTAAMIMSGISLWRRSGS